jgi:putative transposase
MDNGIYHVLNRGNGRMKIFSKDGDFASFVSLLEEGRERFDMRICGYCLMHNHWHLVLWPKRGEQLSKFMQWLSTTHVRRWRAHRSSDGEGHLYQGRYKSFLVQDDEHFLTVMRYLESNPLRAKIVSKAQEWMWSSLGSGAGSKGEKVQVSQWPVDRPGDWLRWVNREMEEEEVERLRVSVKRNRPYGEEKWVKKVVKKLGLESSVRDPWRPRKKKTERENK